MVGVFKILEFKLDDWTILKNIFTNINEIIDELVIECNPEGLKFNALDRSHICFFGCKISKKVFDEYFIDNILYLYIDVNEFVKVLKRGKKSDNLKFKANSSTFDLIFENTNTRKFSITQIDMSDNSRELPNMDFNIMFEFDFDSINNSIKDAELYSDRLTFTCDDNNLILSCEGSFGNYHNNYLLDNIEGNGSATYSIDWLQKMFNTKLSSEKFKIKMGNDYPMLIQIEENGINLNYLLAPRIDNGE